MLKAITLVKIQEIIQLAKACYEDEESVDNDVTLEKGSSGFNSVNPKLLELEKAIENLGKEGMAELSAVMWVGRGEPGTFSELYEHALEMHSDATSGYIAEKMPLAMYLEDGLLELNIIKAH